MIIVSGVAYIFLKSYSITILNTNYQLGYLISLFLNNQWINMIFLTLYVLLVWKKIQFPLFTGILIYTYYFTLFSSNLNLNLEWPMSLWIGLNTIHPYVYYLSFIFLIVLSWQKFAWELKISYNLILYTFCFALLLGMIWGSVNDLWGFFWVDDLIEFVLLLLVTLTLYQLHIYRSPTIHSLYIYLLTIMSILFCVRWGIAGSRHSFFLELQIASYANYLWVLLGGIYSAAFPLLRLILSGYITFQLYIFIYLILFFYLYTILTHQIKSTSLLILHIGFLCLLLIWLFSFHNYTLYYSYINPLTHTRFTFLDNIYLMGDMYILLVKSLQGSILKIPHYSTTVTYLYKLTYASFYGFISYGYFFINIFLIFLYKRYFTLGVKSFVYVSFINW